ncbi:MAG: SpaA isopeptide-forming pilin-related protein [Actinomycetes bacterium]
MSTAPHPRTSTRRPEWRRVVTSLAALVAVVATTLPAAATHSTPLATQFEIDGNIAGTSDWQGTGGERTPDLVNSQDDVSFTPSKTESNYGTWTIERHKPNPDSDLHRLWVDGQVAGATNSFLWAAASRFKPSGANSEALVEFNQVATPLPAVPADGTAVPWNPTRTPGDFRIRFGFPGNSGVPPDMLLSTWTGSGWSTETLLTAPLARSASGELLEPRDFLELELNLGALVSGGILSCGQIGQAWFRTESSAGGNPTMKDLAGPVPVDLEICGSARIRKVVDATAEVLQPLQGASFSLFQGTATTGTPFRTCVSGTDGWCDFGRLLPGQYTAVETAAPAGYALGATTSWTFTLGALEHRDIAVVGNPRLEYRITVAPNGINEAGDPHEFEVRLEQLAPGGTWTAVPDGTEVNLDWVGDGAITEVNGGPAASTCVTTGGVCSVVVTSADPGTGDLFASFDTPYQHTSEDPVATETGGLPLATIGDGAWKRWIGWVVDVAPDGLNLTGEDHEFTISVWADDGDSRALAPGVDVTTKWVGPAGSTADAGGCTTGEDGTCTITVSSSSPGEGTLTVTGVDGFWSEFETQVDVFSPAKPSATKRWVAYRATLDGNAVNPTGEAHGFEVTVWRNDGGGWVLAPDGSVDFDVSGPAHPDDADTCDALASGTCTITVNRSTTGSRTVTLTDIHATYPFDDEVLQHHVPLVEGADGWVPGEDDLLQATKTWVDLSLSISPESDVNLLPVEPDHPLTVTLTSSDPKLVPVSGRTIQLTLTSLVATITSANGEIAEDGLSASCTTGLGGTCDVVITSTTPGTAVLSASADVAVGEHTVELTSDPDGAKRWTTYRVTVTPESAQNHVGDPHDFTVLVEVHDGTGFVPVVGAVPSITVTPDAVAATATSDCDDGTGQDGTCTVTVNSPTPTVATVSASYLGAVGQSQHLFSSDPPGSKEWIQFDLVVSDDAENLTGTTHTFDVTVTLDRGEDDAGPLAVEGVFPTVWLTEDSVGSIVTDGCADDGTDDQGVCQVVITSSTPGRTTLQAEWTGVAGTGEFATERTVDDEGVKTWVDVDLLVDPPTAINALGDPHTFTFTLLEDRGPAPEEEQPEFEVTATSSTAAPLAGEDVAIVLSGVGTITAIDDGTIDAGARSGTCTTDAAGTCRVTIVSAVPGTSTLTGSYLAVVGETERVEDATGTKDWAAIGLVKEALVEADADDIKAIVYDPDAPPTIEYRYTITNLGPVPLDTIVLVDDVLGTLLDGTEGTVLQPGDEITVTATHPVTAADNTAGSVANVAVVTGLAPDDTEVTATDDEEVFLVEVLPSVIGIDLVKEALVPIGSDGLKGVVFTEGETTTIRYRYRIENTGEETLTDVTLVDDVLGTITLPTTTLAPGQVIEAFADHVVTEADADRGDVLNVAVVTGQSPIGPATDTDREQVYVTVVFDEVLEPPLPATGADTARLGAVGLLAMLLGAATVLLSRRRPGDVPWWLLP